MLIEELIIRGFKSFGNNEQKLKLNTQEGELILLTGSNGSGKSSLISSVEFAIYGKCRGRAKKWSTLSTLPNRINGELLNKIKFKSNGVDVLVERGVSPNILKLHENNIENTKAGKSNLNDIIENYVGMDIETFKSFISMSVNDFKNFISLSNEEKKLLLDKLFNLEVVNILNDISKELNKQNKKRLTELESEISTLEDSIERIKESIKKSLEKEKEDLQKEIDEVKKTMESKKNDYIELQKKVNKVEEKEEILKLELEKEKKQLSITDNDINNVNKELKLYDKGKCPTCATPFDSDHFLNLRNELVNKEKGLKKVKSEIENNIKKIKQKGIKLNEITKSTIQSFNDLKYLLKNYKTKIKELEGKKDKSKKSSNTSEFEKTIKDLKSKKSKSHDSASISKEKELYYKELNRVFGEDGVKKSIIKGIIKPINIFIAENLKSMNLPFEVQLDETFTASIKMLGKEIEHDTLSTGENKRVNIAILVSYLKLLRSKRFINILFLDEIFASIDLTGIEDILRLLKSFANEYNINIFVVHHAMMNEEIFDRIISVEKDIFTTLIEKDFKDI